MAALAALPYTADQHEPAPSRDEVLARYRRLREISRQHHNAILELISRDALVRHARGLGLVTGKTFVADRMEDLYMAYDLAIYTAPAGRSRAVDRFAGSARFTADSDEARVLEAMCNAVFAIVKVERRHPVAGLIVKDLLRDIDLWLVDEGLEISMPAGAAFATRYYAPDRFIVTAGVFIPFDNDLLKSAVGSMPVLLRKSPAEAMADRRFAEALYRAAIGDGTMGRVAYRDPSETGETG